MGINTLYPNAHECKTKQRGMQDALDVLKGKWSVYVIGYLVLHGKSRFNEMQRSIPGITAKMLSKELKDLEMNKLVKRTVIDSMPVAVEYELTEYGSTLEKVISEITHWGLEHRKVIMQP